MSDMDVATPLPSEDWHSLVRAWSSVQSRASFRGTGENLARYIALVGPEDFSRITYAKAKELEVVDESETWDGDELVTYFTFRRAQS